MQLAARKAGVFLKKIEIDDSEFPFLVGFICDEGDFAKVTEQIKKNGWIRIPRLRGQPHPFYVINIVPWRAFPPQSLRKEIFFHRISSQE